MQREGYQYGNSAFAEIAVVDFIRPAPAVKSHRKHAATFFALANLLSLVRLLIQRCNVPLRSLPGG
jgi:hypothetical protein